MALVCLIHFGYPFLIAGVLNKGSTLELLNELLKFMHIWNPSSKTDVFGRSGSVFDKSFVHCFRFL